MTNSRFQKISHQFNSWIEQTNYSKKVKINYISIIKNLFVYLDSFSIDSLNDVNIDLVLKFLQSRKNREYAANFIEYRKSVLHLFFQWAYTNHYCRNNFIIEQRKSELNKKASLHEKKHISIPLKDLLTQEEQDLILNLKTDDKDLLSVRNKCIVLLILAGALYAEEVITLQKTALNLSAGLLNITNEDKKERIIQLDLNLCNQACSGWLAVRSNMLKQTDCPKLFFTRNITSLTKRVLYKIVSEFLQEVGIVKGHLCPEMLRQTAICNMVRRGLSLEEIQANTGLSVNKIDQYRQACLYHEN